MRCPRAIALLLVVIGCAQERPLAPGQRARPLQLREHVGQRITVRGSFSLRGKQAPFVLVGDVPVYLEAETTFNWGEPYVSMENREVSITGVLRRFEPPRTATAVPDSVQEAPPYFYFDLDVGGTDPPTHPKGDKLRACPTPHPV